MKRARDEEKSYDNKCKKMCEDEADNISYASIRVNASKKEKKKALYRAAENGHAEIAKVLIQNGANVNAVDKNKRTALYRAASNGHVDVAKVLILNGADVNAVTEAKQTPLHRAAKNRHDTKKNKKNVRPWT